MPTFTFECENGARLAAPRRAAHSPAATHRLAQAAPGGEAPQAIEGHAPDGGRQWAGGGPIEQLVDLRRKRTGARWRTAGAGPFVEFVALADSPGWDEDRMTPAA